MCITFKSLNIMMIVEYGFRVFPRFLAFGWGGEGVVVGCEYWCTHLPSEKAKIAKTPKG
jgi:hypothetical protein